MEKYLAVGDLVNVVSYLETLSSEQLTKQLANHTMDGLPTLHYISRIRFLHEAKPHLDQLIKMFVDSGYDINRRTDLYKAKKRASLGFTALLAAVERCNLLLLESLIQNGAKTDVRDDNGFSACHWAILVGDIRCLEKLISSGSPVASTEQERNGEGDVHPIIHTAVDEGRSEIVFYLLDKGIMDVNEAAVYQGVLTERAFTEFPSRYNNKPASLETKDKTFTPLERAVRMRKIPLVEMLLKCKNIKPPGFSELHFCIVEGDTEVACLLKGYFSDEELCNDKIWSQWALHCLHPVAFQEEQQVLRLEKTKEIVYEYVDSGWDINSVSGSAVNPRPFKMTCRECRWCSDVVFPLKFYLTDYTLLHLACIYESHEIIKCVVEEEADVNLRTGGEALLYPVQISILLNQWDSAAYLIQKGADLNAVGSIKKIQFTRFWRCWNKDSEGQNPIEPELEEDTLTRFNAVELLLRRGRNDGLNLLTVAMSQGSIVWHGANEFQIAIEGGNPLYVSEILEHCAPLMTKDDLTWVKYYKQDQKKFEKVPSLLWLLNSLLKEQSEVDVDALAGLIKKLVSLGYDCNLTCPDEPTRQEIGIQDPLLFTVLEIDFKHETTVVLESLLEADHVQINVRNLAGRNPVEHVMHLWHENCMTSRKKCWRNPAKNYCATTVKLLVNHGVDVSEMTLGDNIKYHYGYKPMLQLLSLAGANLSMDFFESPVCHSGYVGTRSFPQEIQELQAWKERSDGEDGLTLRNLSRLAVRKNLKIIGDAKALNTNTLPKLLIEELQIRT